MAVERLVALIIGVMTIGFGLVLLPFADALRRRMLANREQAPIAGLRLIHGLPRTWRNHLIPWFFVLTGTALLAFAAFGA